MDIPGPLGRKQNQITEKGIGAMLLDEVMVVCASGWYNWNFIS